MVAVTIKDVSVKCGLSVSTISKALNHYSDIPVQTRELVHRVAMEMGYCPNAVARSLRTKRSNNLGVLFSDDEQSGLTHSFFSQVLEAFKCESEKHGYDITFINHNIGGAGMTYLEHCHYRNVDGVCVVCADYYSAEVRELAASSIPCVTIDHEFNNRSCVMSDNVYGMQLLVHQAARLGHRRISFVHGQHSAVTEKRVIGYCRALKELGIILRKEYLVEALYNSPDAGYQAMMQLMQLPNPPSCVLMPDDQAYMGALDAADALGLCVPEDVSLAGYDGIRLGQLLRPQITTIRQDTRYMGTQAAQYLMDQIENPYTAIGRVSTVPVQLIRGHSIGPVKA